MSHIGCKRLSSTHGQRRCEHCSSQPASRACVDLGTTKLVQEVGDKWIGYQSFLVSLLRFLKSTQSRRVPSFFFVNRTGALLATEMIR